MRRAGAFLLCMLSGCGGTRAAGTPDLRPAVPADDRVSSVFVAALDADARLEPADSLYEQGAIVVANGEARFAPPRYAGVGAGGGVAVTSSRIEVRAGLAWAQVEYRWMSTAEGVVREGRATFVLVPDPAGGWRIRHAHSSSP
jgi:hypothetical protein